VDILDDDRAGAGAGGAVGSGGRSRTVADVESFSAAGLADRLGGFGFAGATCEVLIRQITKVTSEESA
jgi:hypothetical protein